MRILAALPCLALFFLASAAQAESGIIAKRSIPPAIAAQVECGTEPENITREPFAGGYLFKWQCASNHANYIVALVFARTADGANPALLRFPAPRGSDLAALEELSNAKLFPAVREISSLFVDPEDGEVCRTEARWRLGKNPLQPELVFWRDTPDCDGKNGWRVRVNKPK